MIVAIDGPAGTGKSSVAATVAERAGFLYLNSGAFYRAVTLTALKNHVDMEASGAITRLARKVSLGLDEQGVSIDGTHPGDELRSRDVDMHVARVSSIPEIRDLVNKKLLQLADKSSVVAEGRDMATVVFPNAELKVYLDASIDARARRRYSETKKDRSFEEIRDSIAERDQIDKNKRVGRLKVDPAALYIDTSDLTLYQVCDMVLRAILHKNQDNGSN